MFELFVTLFYFSVCFFVLVYFWRKVYFKRLSAVQIKSDGELTLVSVKPGRRFYRYLCQGGKLGSARVDGFMIFYSNLDTVSVSYDNVDINSTVYVFDIGPLGRLRSVDVSDRRFKNFVSEFK